MIMMQRRSRPAASHKIIGRESRDTAIVNTNKATEQIAEVSFLCFFQEKKSAVIDRIVEGSVLTVYSVEGRLFSELEVKALVVESKIER